MFRSTYKLGEATVVRRDRQPWITAHLKDHAQRRLEHDAARVVYELVSHVAGDGHRSRAQATRDYTRNVLEPNSTCIMQGCIAWAMCMHGIGRRRRQ